jgi:polar amino acid transport system substrate-binding protein
MLAQGYRRAMTPSPEARAQLAPRGKMRVGLNYANFLLVAKDSTVSAPGGIAADLAREAARRAGIEIDFQRFDAPAKLADAIRDEACDAGFLAVEPQRAEHIAFTAAYLEIESGYLVRGSSPITSVEQVDRPGVRIAVADKSAFELWLTRNVKHATLVRAEGLEGSYRVFLEQKLEALACLKQALINDAARFPNTRLLPGRFTAVQQAIGVPKARTAAAAWLSAYVEDMKASGFVAQAIEKHGVKGVTVAPISR